MDQSKLATASTYVNNLLLARGLLRNGAPIDFASLSGRANNREADRAPDDQGERQDDAHGHEQRKNERRRARHADTQAAADVINLVHDLVLRRDVRFRSGFMKTYRQLTKHAHSATTITPSISL